MDDAVTLAAKKFKSTTWCCYIGCLAQGAIMNFAPIFFIALRQQFGLSYTQLGALITANYVAQVVADLVFGRPVDKFGFRPFVYFSLICMIVGLIMFGTLPVLFPGNAYVLLLISTVIYSLAVGLGEVLFSPIISAIPSDNPGAAMSTLHSYFAWGITLTAVIGSLGLFVFGTAHWNYVPFFWAAFAFANLIMFIRSPFPPNIAESAMMKIKDVITNRIFILGFFTIFFGAAAELTLVAWLSSFLEKGLGLNNVIGDLIGLGGFGVSLGVARIIYGTYGKKINVNDIMIIGGIVAVFCYLVLGWTDMVWLSIVACCLAGAATAFMWPGTLTVTSTIIPTAGVLVFGLLAAGGDFGTAFLGWATGIFSDFFAAHAPALTASAEQYGLRMGILVSAIYPLLAFVFAFLLKRQKKQSLQIAATSNV